MGRVYMLRTCAEDMTDHGGFRWPESGPVECPDWDPSPECGGGLHGLLHGEGDGALLDSSGDARWLIVECESADVVDLGGKVKVPRGVVVYCGDRDGATARMAELCPGRAIAYGTATAGDRGTATAGDRGTATAGDRGTATAGYRGTATAGYRGTATAGYRGTATAGYYGTATSGDHGTATAGDHGTATSGDWGTATAGDHGAAKAGYRGAATSGAGGTATSGDHGTATSGDWGTATAGDWGTATAGDSGAAKAGYRGAATSGDGGTATAGDRGTVCVRWHDGRRYRLAVGYVGEDGIEAGVAYHVVDGRLVAVTS